MGDIDIWKILVISVALAIVASSVAVFSAANSDIGLSERGIVEGGGKGVIMLEMPPFIGVAGASEVSVMRKGTNFLEEEVGISAYTNVGETIDLEKAKEVYRTIEVEKENYTIGSVALPGIDSDDGIFEKTVTADDELSQENYFALMPKMIYVPDDYAKIQYAVDNAGAGDTIIVRDGTYIENINVNKRLTIKSENGSENCIIHAADPGNSIFMLTANYINLSGFTVEGTTAAYTTGIYLRNANHCYITNNIASKNRNGIFLDSSTKNTIEYNNASNNVNSHGISLSSSNNNEICNNIANSNHYQGIGLWTSSGNIIANNTCSNNKNGIFLQDSSSNNISNNTCSSNKNADPYPNNEAAGITLQNSRYNSISNNTCSYNDAGITLRDSNRNSISNNTCSYSEYTRYRLIYRQINKEDAGITLWNSRYNSISNNTCLYNKEASITLRGSNHNSISNNICSYNSNGISIGNSEYIPPWGSPSVGSNQNSISNNICSYNSNGISLVDDSKYNTVSNNICSNNYKGISLSASNNTISNNTCSYNSNGLTLSWYSTNNSISNNTCSYNMYYGIHLYYGSNNCNIINNTCSYNMYDGILLEDSNHNNISNNNCSYNRIGISLWDSEYDPIVGSNHNNICNNTCSHNDIGIYLRVSNCCSISKNHCSSNDDYGIFLDWSDKNFIYLNNFINNANNADSYGTSNIWNSIEKINYIYTGTTYTNYLGNYWDDYRGSDTNNDGIGDTPYQINADKDDYPLMQPWENYFIEENGTNTKSETSQFTFSSYYQPINISVNLSVPPYQLPLNLSTVSNIENITAKLGLNKTEEELLETNGFVILDYGQEDDIVAAYKDMKDMGIPIFVTSDTLLHLYHIQFNEILKGIEEREFFDELVDMSNAMLNQSVKDHENFDDADLKESARRNVAYFAVALKLLQTPTEGYSGEDIKVINFSIPDYVNEDVNKELENIAQHEGFHPSAIFNSNPNCICDYPCCYCEDYSQYVPRGHYTRSEQLKRYFKAMMWYGRIAFMLKGCNGDEALISERDANLSTIQAALIASELPDVTVNNSTAQEIWDRIYTVTAFFVGTADDLTPYEYRDAQNIVFGTAYNASDLSDEDKLLELKVELAKLRSPEIYGGSGVCVVYPPITEAKLYECLDKTKGMRFMGQRFVPDSYMFQQLVSPAVGMYTGNGTPFTMCITEAGPARCFPCGLDIMTVLGSERAGDILIEEGDTEYAGPNTSYEKQLNELKSEFTAFNSADWNRNLYWSWLYTLKPLLKDFSDGYPTFMQTKAWQNKALQTALASWTELRHDTILYGKQSYTPSLKGMPPKPKPVVGYVEPVPEFYARLLALTEMTEKGLVDLDVLNETEKARLHNLGLILERLMNISVAELENETLTEEDYKFINDFGANLDSLVSGVNAKGKETTIVADVHTDDNTGMVLEEGVGYVDLILVAYIVPDGRIIVGAGPVLSYYEFKQPMDDRLTDEKWKEMLKTEPPEKPGWVKEICSEIAPTTTADTAILHATVIDKTTGEPIENVIVYLGSMGGSGKCYTDGGGKCSIEGVSWGSYAVNVFKKGYNRPASKRGNIGKEEKNISVELKLEKKSEIPTSFTVEGTVIEIITAEGTLSENHYYKIRDDDGNEEYLFNKIGVNQGFEEFVNKRVRITGFREIGFIGWQHEKVEGIYVEEIEVIQ